MNSKKTVMIITIAIVLVTSLNAVAQGRGGGRGGQGHKPPAPAVDSALDSNDDQTISADEIANAAAALIGLDANQDDGLTFAECMGFSDQGRQQTRPAGQGGSGRQPPVPPIFSALDSNGDEVIVGYEISDAPESLLVLDSNGDGALQSGEYMPSRPAKR